MSKPRRATYVYMKKMEFIKYEAPEVEIMEVMVEQGFAMSGGEEGDGNASAGGMGDLN